MYNNVAATMSYHGDGVTMEIELPWRLSYHEDGVTMEMDVLAVFIKNALEHTLPETFILLRIPKL